MTREQSQKGSGVRKMLSVKAVSQQLATSQPTIRRWSEKKKFPAPVKIGQARIAYFEDEIIAWQEERAKNRVL
jgi:predicted DNA-binding transcriptional regulator AlpA